MSDLPALSIFLAVLLVMSLLTMVAWGSVWRGQSPRTMRLAAAASAAWFAVVAATIALMFDVGWVP